MYSPGRHLYEFDCFCVDPLKRQLLRDGQPVSIPPKVFNTLLTLIEQRGQVVSKDDLLARLWPDTVVEEANLTVYISALRKTLGEGKRENRYIVTVPGQGYQFIGDVRQINGADAGKVDGLEVELPEPESLSERNAKPVQVPAEVAGITEPGRAPEIARRPAVRFGWLLAVLSVLLILAASAALYRWLPAAQTPTAIKTIAVLPFSLFSDNKADEYLGVALADALIMRLSHIRQVTVRPTSAVLKYNQSYNRGSAVKQDAANQDAAQQDSVAIGLALGVDAVLEGSVRKAGNVVRVSVQFVRVADGKPLWAEKFDEKTADVLTLEDRVSARVAAALAVNLTDEERERLARRYTTNFEAYQEYLRGRFHLSKRTPEDLRESLNHFSRALELDSRFALAWAGLADSYALLGFRVYNSLPPHEAMPQAKSAALRALELDQTLAEAHGALGLVKLRYEWDFAGAEEEFKRAIALNPGYATARQWYAELLWLTKRGDEAFAESEAARRSDPSSIALSAAAAIHFYYRREYDRATAQCQKMRATDANSYLPYLVLGLILQQQQKPKEAEAELEQSLRAGAGRTGRAALGYLYAKTGRRDAALRLLEEFRREAKQTYVDPTFFAALYSGLGATEQTLEWLEKGYQDRSTAMIYLSVDPRYDWLHTDSRFTELVRRIGIK